MKASELHDRVLKLEQLLKELAKWTNFDLQNFDFSDAQDKNGIGQNAKKRRQERDTGLAVAKKSTGGIPKRGKCEDEIIVKLEEDESFDNSCGFDNFDEIDPENAFEVFENESPDKDQDFNSEQEDEQIAKDPLFTPHAENLKLASDLPELESPKTRKQTQTKLNNWKKYKPLQLPPLPPPSPPQVSLIRTSDADLLQRGLTIPIRYQKRKQKLPVNLTCEECGFIAISKPKLQQHRRKHIRSFPCPHCSYFAQSNPALKYHVASKHEEDDLSRPFECGECPEKFRFEQALKRHIRKHKEPLEKNFLCHYCPFGAKTRGPLNQHIRRVHDKAISVKCYFCQEMTNELILHMRTHTGEHPYKCEKCPFRATAGKNIRTHILYVHNEEGKAFQCDKCPCSFKSKGRLTYHARLHDKSQLKCGVCEFEAVSFSSLRKHEEDNHRTEGGEGQGGRKGFQCPHCPSKFKMKWNLQQHVRCHTGERPYKCESCNYDTGTRSCLLRHQKLCKGGGRQENKELFPCDVCNLKFTSSGNVSRHKAMWHSSKHRLEKIDCGACNESFKDEKSLNSHMKMEHENEPKGPTLQTVSTIVTTPPSSANSS